MSVQLDRKLFSRPFSPGSRISRPVLHCKIALRVAEWVLVGSRSVLGLNEVRLSDSGERNAGV